MSVGPEMRRVATTIGEFEQYNRAVLARGNASSEEIRLLRAQDEDALSRLAQLPDELHL